MPAYYNEIDPFAAAWLRELIRAGLIAPGDVDERDIRDVTPNDVAPYDQCHFFAGIGTWSYALRQAGWADNRPVWTGSCPCQPFSSAGTRDGFDDERHLWPSWFWLISQSAPGVVFGEQVVSRDGLAWLDVVYTDLENAGYAVGALDLCAAGFGAPHLRQRLYFVADASGTRRQGHGLQQIQRGGDRGGAELCLAGPSATSELAESERLRWSGRGLGDGDHAEGEGRGAPERCINREPAPAQCATRSMADARSQRRQQDTGSASSHEEAHGREGRDGGQPDGDHLFAGPGPTNGFWRSADWLPCRDGKYRAVEPGTFPLAHGATARVGRLRGYGNAIVAPLAVEFIRAYMERCD